MVDDVRIYDEVLDQDAIDYISDPDHYGDGLTAPANGGTVLFVK